MRLLIFKLFKFKVVKKVFVHPVWSYNLLCISEMSFASLISQNPLKSDI